MFLLYLYVTLRYFTWKTWQGALIAHILVPFNMAEVADLLGMLYHYYNFLVSEEHVVKMFLLFFGNVGGFHNLTNIKNV